MARLGNQSMYYTCVNYNYFVETGAAFHRGRNLASKTLQMQITTQTVEIQHGPNRTASHRLYAFSSSVQCDVYGLGLADSDNLSFAY